MVLVVKYLKDALARKDVEWWIKFRNPNSIIKDHLSFFYCEVAFYIIAFLTFSHAFRVGGRYKWLWIASLLHGLTVECVSYFLPDIDNFWHAQSMVMLLGQRLPLHIVLLYPGFIYTAAIAVSQMKLRSWAEPFAVGLAVVLLDIPYDIMGIKLLWWTWHDDDPNIYDRHYWVPWTSYYFHAAFASSFTFIFNHSRRLLCQSTGKFQSSGCIIETICAVITGLFSMPLGVLQFVPIYHYFHDQLNIHTEVCLLLLLATYVMIVWSSDRVPYLNARIGGVSKRSILELIMIVLFHYSLYIYLVITEKPQYIQSTGYHQSIGSCTEKVPVKTPFGQVLSKRKHLCLLNYDEDVFNFKCLDKRPANGAEWYTICGTPYPNHLEYIIVVTAFCVFGLFFYFQAMLRSGHLSPTKAAKVKHHKE
ncbi:uncharacterized protein LOC126810101 isoform X1 [Patella vulgata]|uniref:uncharacterized protein LOC126810101 isoform X1 n=2 Tax=Patella vulgata TaxID=6465 RepID=UPI0021800E79|nr:uncharacterized protein LOC126810101 isoform X1 [Patella vulgata]